MTGPMPQCSERARIWLLVLISYGIGRLGVRVLVYGTWSITPELAVQLLIVPAAEIACLELARVFWRATW
jgi:hypothetical protein